MCLSFRDQRSPGPTRPSCQTSSPALAALIPGSNLSSTSSSAFRPSLCQRSPSPVTSSARNTPSSSPFRPTSVSSPTDGLTYTDPSFTRATNIAVKSVKTAPTSSPSLPSSSAFTRSLAASCISQSISQSMSKKTQPQTNPKSPPSTPSLPSTLHLRQRSPSPKLSTETHQHQKSFLWSPQTLTNHSQRQHPPNSYLQSNTNNNNNLGNAHSSLNWAANGSPSVAVFEQNHETVWSASHNRVARPFCTSEPNSRAQSPTSFNRLCSPPPQHDFSSPMANKPPNPRRPGSTHNPLGLTLDLNRAPSTSSSCLSPRIVSPPPIGVSVNAWTNNIVTPQPQNARFSPSPTSAYPTFSPTSMQNSRAASPSFSPTPKTAQPLRRSFSTNLADRPPGPVRSSPNGLRRSWTESSRRSLNFNGSVHGLFDQQESGLCSPRIGWMSPALACLSPRSGLQSPVSPGKFTPGRGAVSGQHFTNVPWSDEVSQTYRNGADFDSGVTRGQSTILFNPPEMQKAEWDDSDLEDGNCRSQIICAYVARPAKPSTQSDSNQMAAHQNLVTPTLSTRSSSLPFAQSSQVKPASQKTSYATTVNLQIAGSGRITSFSTAQVSLSQTLQNGQTGQGALTRRVSVNGLTPLPQ